MYIYIYVDAWYKNIVKTKNIYANNIKSLKYSYFYNHIYNYQLYVSVQEQDYLHAFLVDCNAYLTDDGSDKSKHKPCDFNTMKWIFLVLDEIYFFFCWIQQKHVSSRLAWNTGQRTWSQTTYAISVLITKVCIHSYWPWLQIFVCSSFFKNYYFDCSIFSTKKESGSWHS